MSAANLVLGEGTKGRILEELMGGPRSAKDLSGMLRIRESAVRVHLEKMVERGLVSPSFHREGVGRPRKRFRLTSEGQELFPRHYEMLLDSVVGSIREREGEAYLTTLFTQAAERFASEVARELPAVSPRASKEERLRAVVAVLNRLGQRAEVVRTGKSVRIVRRNCIFRACAIKDSHLLCEVFDQHLLESLLGHAGVDLTDSIARGGSACSHLIQLAPA